MRPFPSEQPGKVRGRNHSRSMERALEDDEKCASESLARALELVNGDEDSHLSDDEFQLESSPNTKKLKDLKYDPPKGTLALELPLTKISVERPSSAGISSEYRWDFHPQNRNICQQTKRPLAQSESLEPRCEPAAVKVGGRKQPEKEGVAISPNTSESQSQLQSCPEPTETIINEAAPNAKAAEAHKFLENPELTTPGGPHREHDSCADEEVQRRAAAPKAPGFGRSPLYLAHNPLERSCNQTVIHDPAGVTLKPIKADHAASSASRTSIRPHSGASDTGTGHSEPQEKLQSDRTLMPAARCARPVTVLDRQDSKVAKKAEMPFTTSQSLQSLQADPRPRSASLEMLSPSSCRILGDGEYDSLSKVVQKGETNCFQHLESAIQDQALTSPCTSWPIPKIKQPPRIEKTSTKIAPISSLPRSSAAETTGASGGNVPSEEDLYFLLIHRQRQRKETEIRMTARQKHLEVSHAQLSQQNRQYKFQIEAAATRQRELQSQVDSRKSEVEDVQGKYTKLRAFVKGLSNDYESLRKEADVLKKSQHSLSREREELRRDLQQCEASSESAATAVSKVQDRVAKIRQSSGCLEESLHLTKLKLDTESKLLLTEQRKNKRLEVYLTNVANTQNKYSVAIQQEQRMMLGRLDAILTKVVNVEGQTMANPQPLNIPEFDQLIDAVQALRNVDRVVPADINDMVNAVNALSESLDTHQKRSSEAIYAVNEANSGLEKRLLDHITMLAHSTHSEVDQQASIKDLQIHKACLEVEINEGQKLLKEIRDGRCSAEERERHLRVTTEALMKELSGMRHHLTSVKESNLAERDGAQEMRIKWLALNSELTKKQQMLDLKEQELCAKSQAIEDLNKNTSELLARHEKAENTLKAAEDELLTTKQQATVHLEELAKKENCIDALRAENNVMAGKHRDAAEEMMRLEQSHHSQTEDLRKASSELCFASEECSSTKCKVRNLETDNEKLNKDQYEALKKIKALEDKLQEAELAHEQVKALETQAGTMTQEVNSLQEKLQAASEKAALEALQHHVLNRQTQEIHDLKQKLAAVEDVAQQISGLQQDKTQLSGKCTDLGQPVDLAKIISSRLETLEVVNERKDDEILVLRQRLAATEKALKHLEDTEEKCREKDVQLTALQSRVAEIECVSSISANVECKPTGPSQEHGLSQGMIQDLLELEETNVQELHEEMTTKFSNMRERDGGDKCGPYTLVECPPLVPDSQATRPPSPACPSQEGASGFDFRQNNQGSPRLPSCPPQSTVDTTLISDSQPPSKSKSLSKSIREGKDADMTLFSPPSNSEDLFPSSDLDVQKSIYFANQTQLNRVSTAAAEPTNKIPKSLKRKVTKDAGMLQAALDLGPPVVDHIIKKVANNRPPSSSYGEPMLMEDFENSVDIRNYSVKASAARQTSSQGSRIGSLDISSGLHFALPDLDRHKRLEPNSDGHLNITPKRPSPRRLRSKIRSDPKRATPLTERPSSSLNSQTSPQTGNLKEKNRPNSAIKRLPEPEQSEACPGHSSPKRMKRNPSALEVRSTLKQTPASSTDQSRPLGGRLNHPSLPIGSRKGSVVGTHAPAPGASQRSERRSRKSSKSDRYSARFGQNPN